jgi:hypothetical protein
LQVDVDLAQRQVRARAHTHTRCARRCTHSRRSCRACTLN